MRAWIAILALLTAFPPLSIDMILPALPAMAEFWAIPLATVNLVLISFFTTYALFLLIYGPLSDRFGRRGPLLFGVGLYILSSILGGLSESIFTLVASRVLQAAGAAAASSMAMAMSKDLFSGAERARVLATIGVIMALAPMMAPVFGGWVLAIASWPWIFFSQALFGVAALLGVLRIPETHAGGDEITIVQVLRSYGRLLRNRSYVSLTLLMAVCMFPLYGFIAASASIYITGFGTSEQVFGYFFALNALSLMAGSFGCLRLVKGFDSTTVMTMGFVGVVIGSLGILAGTGLGPWGFALPMSLITFSLGLSRPSSNNLILEQVQQDAGAASSLLLFTFFLLGALSMWVTSLQWESRQAFLGLVGTACGLLSLFTWLALRRKLALRRE
jgi:MFS transporter, DHA1 family, multidrug resistance protein